MIGMVFGQLTVTADAYPDGTHKRWLCQCICGNTTKTRGAVLRQGRAKSCGCVTLKRTHGLSSHPLYNVWGAMIRRCSPTCQKSKKAYYYEKGIRVCLEWQDVEKFIDWASANGWRQGLEIDRIESVKNYCPNNCRWVSRSDNNSNKHPVSRNTSGFSGVSKCNLRWRSYISHQDHRYHLGYFGTVKEAVEVRNIFIKKNGLKHPLQEV